MSASLPFRSFRFRPITVFVMQKSWISPQAKNGGKLRSPAMQKTDASEIPVQWSVSEGVASKAEGRPSFPKRTSVRSTALIGGDGRAGNAYRSLAYGRSTQLRTLRNFLLRCFADNVRG